MAYTRTTWANGSGGGTPISAANLNNIEVELVALDLLIATLAPATSLPGSPVNGQLAILTDSTTAPTYQWLFRYNTTISDANKWQFVGGPPTSAEVATSESRNSTSYGDTATVHSLTLARAGVYEFSYGMVAEQDSGENNAQFMSPKYSASEAVDGDAAYFSANWGTNAKLVPVTRTKRFTVASASQVVTMRYKQGTASTTSPVSDRWLKVTPVRVA